MPTFRCYDCDTEFEDKTPAVTAKLPICPSCGAIGEQRLARLELIHFDPPAIPYDPERPHIRRGKHHAACDEKIKVGRGGMFSGEPNAVTCKVCMETEAFKLTPPTVN